MRWAVPYPGRQHADARGGVRQPRRRPRHAL